MKNFNVTSKKFSGDVFARLTLLKRQRLLTLTVIAHSEVADWLVQAWRSRLAE